MNKIVVLILFVFWFNSLNAQNEIDKTKILILGTPHLSQIDGFAPEMLDNLISKLSEINFDAICIESMPAQLRYDIESRNDSAFADVLSGFGGNRLSLAESSQRYLGITFLQAQEETRKLLIKSDYSDSTRLVLINNLMASADLESANSRQYSLYISILSRETNTCNHWFFPQIIY